MVKSTGYRGHSENRTKERMVENFHILDFTLSDEEMQTIAAMDTGKSPIYDDMDLQTAKSIGLYRM